MCLCGFGSFYWINNAISGIIVLHWESHPPNEMMTTSCWAKACANAQPAVALANIQGRETVCKTCIIFTLLLQIHFADSGLCHSKTDISVIFNAPHIKYKSMFTSSTLCKKDTSRSANISDRRVTRICLCRTLFLLAIFSDIRHWHIQ